MYEGDTKHVRCMNGCSEPSAVTAGVHQGLPLTPFLFAIPYGPLDGKHQKSTLGNDVCE